MSNIELLVQPDWLDGTDRRFTSYDLARACRNERASRKVQNDANANHRQATGRGLILEGGCQTLAAAAPRRRVCHVAGRAAVGLEALPRASSTAMLQRWNPEK
jgi:hypothetical protein